MRIIKPQKMSLIHKAYCFQEQAYQAFAPIIFFRLSSSEVVTENLQWSGVGQTLGSKCLDMGMPKPEAELLLAGSAYGQGDSKTKVSVKVGELSKSITVCGNSTLKSRFPFRVATAPEPFEKISLSWDRAYSGANFPDNPLGKGHKSKRGEPLPNVLHPKDESIPAGFMPLDITVPLRAEFNGTYDQAYIENRLPDLADDTDFRLFNTAPLDQRQTSWFVGDETFTLNGLSPQPIEVVGQLPGVKARLFARLTNQQLEEVAVHLETLWLMTDINLGVLIFRGSLQTSNMPDDLLLAYEGLNDEPKTFAHYEEVLQLRSDIRTMAAHVFNEAQLSPRKGVEQLAKEAAEYQTEILKRKQQTKESLSDLESSTGLTSEATDTSDSADAMVIAPEALERGDFDSTALFAAVEKEVEKASLIQDDQIDNLAALNSSGDSASTPSITERDLDQHFELPGVSDEQLEELQQTAKFANNQSPKAPQVVALGAAEGLRRLVLDRIAAGVPMQGTDLHDADLSGLSFDGADFSLANLSNCDLTSTTFQHCNFAKASLSGSRLDSATFIDCNFWESNFSLASGSNVSVQRGVLRQANLNQAQLADSEFLDCVFEVVTAKDAAFVGSVLDSCEFKQSCFQGVSLVGTEVSQCNFDKVILFDGDLRRCAIDATKFVQCALFNIRGQLSGFLNSEFERCQFTGHTSLLGAQFEQSTFSQCGFRSCNLSMSQWNQCTVSDCDFALADLRFASIKTSNLLNSIFDGAWLNAASLEGVSFHGSGLRETQLADCQLIDVDFYAADVLKTRFAMTNLEQCKNIPTLKQQRIEREHRNAAQQN